MRSTHWILVLLVAGLGGYLAYDLRSERVENERKEEEARLFPFVFDQINHFVMKKASGETIELKRSEDGWRLIQPVDDLSDHFFVDDFVRRLAEEKHIGKAREEATGQEAVYGLDQPVGKVTLGTQDGKSRTLVVGSKENFERHTFAQIEDEKPVYLVSSTWPASFERQAREFRDRRLLRAKIGEVRRMEFRGKNEFSLSRTDNTWSSEKGMAIPLDQNRVREVLSMINEARAEDFIVNGAPSASDKKRLGLQSPVLTLFLQVGDDRNWKAEFFRKGNQEMVVVSDPAFVLELEAGTVARFEGYQLDGLRNLKLPFDVNMDGVRQVEWVSPAKKVTLVKTDKWKVEGEEKSPDENQIEKLLSGMKDQRAQGYVEAKDAKQFKAASTLKFMGENDKLIFEIAWGQKSFEHNGQKVRMAKTNVSEHLFYLSEETLESWSATKLMKSEEGGH